MLLSIVTVVRNARPAFKETLESLLKQTSQDFEYIIIDGNSTDGTLEELFHVSHLNPIVVSEKDKGIYDAMNKGVALASGKYLYFLNAGDIFQSNLTIERFLKLALESTEAILHGKVEINYQGSIRVKPAFDLEELWKTPNFCHQGILINTLFHKKNLYDLSYSIVSDFKLAFEAFKNGNTFKKVDMVFAQFATGGVSDTFRLRLLSEKYEVVAKYDKSWRCFLYYKYRMVDVSFRQLIKVLLPPSLVKKIILLKYDK